MASLADRLTKIEALEAELPRKAAPIIQPGTGMFFVDWYVMGAAQRTMAQSRGFRTMIETRNFPGAAILLRTQIDTAMRINGLRYLDRPEEQLSEVFQGEKTFRQLDSWEKTDKERPKKMQDVFLRAKLVEEAPWIDPVYEKTSDFVHLSFRPLFSSIYHLDDDTRTISFAINGEDQTTDESDYFEICDAFFDVTKLTGTFILAILMGRHQGAPDPPV
ncbi:hypothetical protein [Pontitalea aquivivens]|uniref:hypothetical protein n=1 Tax=Pontitalea aquivivens TaxID=3388663 RepID=UPI003970D6F6